MDAVVPSLFVLSHEDDQQAMENDKGWKMERDVKVNATLFLGRRAASVLLLH